MANVHEYSSKAQTAASLIPTEAVGPCFAQLSTGSMVPWLLQGELKEADIGAVLPHLSMLDVLSRFAGVLFAYLRYWRGSSSCCLIANKAKLFLVAVQIRIRWSQF